MSSTYNAIGTPNPDGTLKELGNTAPKADMNITAADVSYGQGTVEDELDELNSNLTQIKGGKTK